MRVTSSCSPTRKGLWRKSPSDAVSQDVSPGRRLPPRSAAVRRRDSLPSPQAIVIGRGCAGLRGADGGNFAHAFADAGGHRLCPTRATGLTQALAPIACRDSSTQAQTAAAAAASRPKKQSRPRAALRRACRAIRRAAARPRHHPAWPCHPPAACRWTWWTWADAAACPG